MDQVAAGLFLGPRRTFVGRTLQTASTPLSGAAGRPSPVRRSSAVLRRVEPSEASPSLILESLALNRSSTILASAVVSVFLAGRLRCAQAAASSAEFIAVSCSIRLSRRLADSCTPRTDVAPEACGRLRSLSALGRSTAVCPFDCLAGCGNSAGGAGPAPRSGASRSSSPAMPTSRAFSKFESYGMLETAASRGWKAKDAIEWFHGIGRLVPTISDDES
jgi:hypothetical protein